MSSLPVFVGLDYHQQSVQVCVLNQEGKSLLNRSVANDAETIRGLVASCGRVASVAIEACSGAAHLADQLILRADWPMHLAHPGYVARMKQNPDKTDYADSRLLADLVRVGYLPTVWLAPEKTRRLRRLVRHRQKLVSSRTQTKLRIRALLRENRLGAPEGVRPWTKAWLRWLKGSAELVDDDRWLMDEYLEEIEHLTVKIHASEARLAAHLEKNPLYERLLAMAGVGPVTAATLCAEIGRFDRFRTGKQLARFCSVTPRNASSGQRQADAGLIKAGNPGLRNVLVELAHRLIRHDQEWRRFAARLLREGKPKNVVVAAVANRWTRRLYHHMQSSTA
jgi:transposase